MPYEPEIGKVQPSVIAWQVKERFGTSEESLMTYLQTMRRMHGVALDGDRYSMNDVLELVGSLFDEERPGLGVDPNRPGQTAFLMGAYLALDTLSFEARAAAIEEQKYLVTWTNSEGFLPVAASVLDKQPEQVREKLLTGAVERLATDRLRDLSPAYAKLVADFGEALTDASFLAPEQIPPLNQGFAFTFIGGKLSIELLALEAYQPNEISEEDLARWLAG